MTKERKVQWDTGKQRHEGNRYGLFILSHHYKRRADHTPFHHGVDTAKGYVPRHERNPEAVNAAIKSAIDQVDSRVNDHSRFALGFFSGQYTNC